MQNGKSTDMSTLTSKCYHVQERCPVTRVNWRMTELKRTKYDMLNEGGGWENGTLRMGESDIVVVICLEYGGDVDFMQAPLTPMQQLVCLDFYTLKEINDKTLEQDSA